VDAQSEAKTRAYYDDFSSHYEARRGGNVPHGYHDLLDHLESDFVQKFAQNRRVLEVGCGTGLILERIQRFASHAEGVDLSPGMLSHASARGLRVREASANALPYPDGSFDVTCSFKVLPHVPDLEGALREMARVTAPGGYVLAEFYNPWSFRGLLRALGPARRIGKGHAEKDVFTRFDTPGAAKALAPQGTRFVQARGVRILTLAAPLLDHPRIGPWLFRAECWAADTPLRQFGGFFIAAFQKD
jgi:ubiquinone/menaquinone biosynthesis C-methylase UbiE